MNQHVRETMWAVEDNKLADHSKVARKQRTARNGLRKGWRITVTQE